MTRAPLATLGKAPNLLTLSRVPLAAIFPFSRQSPRLGLAVLALAGLSDVLDGWSARAFDQHTEFGKFVDPIADKLFMGSVVATLVADGRLPPWGVASLFAREAFELVAAGFVLAQPRKGPHDYGPRAPTAAGKLTTIAQFAATTSAVIAPKLLSKALTIAGILGLAAGVQYATREMTSRGR